MADGHMAVEAGGSLRFLELLESFSGDAPAQLWTESFQQVTHTAGWDDDMALLAAGKKMTGKAKQWYALRRPFENTAVFLQRLREQYPVYPAPPVGDAMAETVCTAKCSTATLRCALCLAEAA
jgi:hypothetical protein